MQDDPDTLAGLIDLFNVVNGGYFNHATESGLLL